jgi:hypothetical protein
MPNAHDLPSDKQWIVKNNKNKNNNNNHTHTHTHTHTGKCIPVGKSKREGAQQWARQEDRAKETHIRKAHYTIQIVLVYVRKRTKLRCLLDLLNITRTMDPTHTHIRVFGLVTRAVL